VRGLADWPVLMPSAAATKSSKSIYDAPPNFEIGAGGPDPRGSL